jgi:nucleoside-diphosphate-sugar epimerase
MRCAITGTSGYVGGILASYFEHQGITVVRLQREAAETSSLQFELSSPIDPEMLLGLNALVHCAWDMKAVAWHEIRRINIEGSRHLLVAAQRAGVRNVVFVSSISAFYGCRSLYGRSKLEVEKIARETGATIVRPALVYGEKLGGMFGKLCSMVQDKLVIPVVAPGQKMFTCHQEDLAACVMRSALGEFKGIKGAIVAASSTPVTMRAILLVLAARAKRKVILLPVPWQVVWLAIRAAEGLGLHLNFRSDSLIGMMYSNSSPDFETARALGLTFRDFGCSSPPASRGGLPA